MTDSDLFSPFDLGGLMPGYIDYPAAASAAEG